MTVLGTPQPDRITLALDATQTKIVVQDDGRVIGQFASSAINFIRIWPGPATQRVLIDGGSGKNG